MFGWHLGWRPGSEDRARSTEQQRSSWVLGMVVVRTRSLVWALAFAAAEAAAARRVTGAEPTVEVRLPAVGQGKVTVPAGWRRESVVAYRLAFFKAL
jgi:hypothetical protein